MAEDYLHNKPLQNNVAPLDLPSHKQLLLHSPLENENNPQDLSICNSQGTSNKLVTMKLLPSIESIITNTGNTSNFEESRECDNSFYNFIDRNTPQPIDKDTLFERSINELQTHSSPLQEPQSSVTIQWEKAKIVNVQPSVSNTSYGIVSHVFEQHFGLKEERYFENVAISDRSDGSCDLPISTSREQQGIYIENKECTILDGDFDSDSCSTETSSVINPYDIDSDEDKSKFIKCDECEMYLKSKGSLKVHMRLHTGIHPYVCKECGQSFFSCSLFHKHKLEHEAIVEKPYSCNECGKEFNCEKHFKYHKKKHLAPKMFPCSECKQRFATKDRLIRHCKIHFGEMSFFCDKCGKIFSNKLSFDEHKLTHANGNWKCEDCDHSVFESPHQLEKHILSVHNIYNTSDNVMQPLQLSGMEDNKRFGCEICPMKFEKMTNYYVHRCNHKTEKSFKCDSCDASFFKEFHLMVHSATHDSYSFVCAVCELKFKSKKALQMHIQKNNHKLPFGCSHCDFSCKEKEQLDSHMKTHCGDKPFSCDQCDFTFRHSSTLSIHQRTHTGETPYVCSVCQASFIQSNHLQIHLRSHSNNKPYKCNECDSSFTKRDYLIAHKTKHGKNGANLIAASIISETNLGSGVATLRCTYCEMSFSHQSTLAAHIRKHTGERPFVCDKCGASFLYSSNLTTHRRKHTGERPYKCKECDASFTLKSYLTMHLRKHSGERPFKCDICESSFTQKTHLSTHRRIHTGEYPYKCDICGDAFRDGANFWRHKKRHSNDDTEKPRSSFANNDNSEGKFRPTKVKKMRSKNSDEGKVVHSAPSFAIQQFVEEGNSMTEIVEDHLITFINKDENAYDHVMSVVKAESYT